MKTKRAEWAFTLMELLVVMAVIAILVALVMGALPGIWRIATIAKTRTEIQALETDLGSFKLDNGAYPPGAASGYDPNNYKDAATSLYTNLSGRMNESAALTGKSYHSFKKSQLNTTGTYPYVQDPFGYAYGYCTNGPSSGNNPGFYDLWSTAGKSDGSQTSTNNWVTNWREK